jgi:hypothetical protein
MMIDDADRGGVVPESGDHSVAGKAANGGRSAHNVSDGIAHDPLQVLSALRAELAI